MADHQPAGSAAPGIGPTASDPSPMTGRQYETNYTQQGHQHGCARYLLGGNVHDHGRPVPGAAVPQPAASIRPADVGGHLPWDRMAASRRFRDVSVRIAAVPARHRCKRDYRASTLLLPHPNWVQNGTFETEAVATGWLVPPDRVQRAIPAARPQMGVLPAALPPVPGCRNQRSPSHSIWATPGYQCRRAGYSGLACGDRQRCIWRQPVCHIDGLSSTSPTLRRSTPRPTMGGGRGHFSGSKWLFCSQPRVAGWASERLAGRRQRGIAHRVYLPAVVDRPLPAVRNRSFESLLARPVLISGGPALFSVIAGMGYSGWSRVTSGQ
jgi:hypothetical protein